MPTEAAGDRTQQLIDALSSPVRREILWLVWDRELTAGDIAGAFTLTAPTISSHLAVLREAGLVAMTRDGTFRRYRARQDEVRSLRGLLGLDTSLPASTRSPGPRTATRLVPTAMVEVDASCAPADAFRAFTDAALYTRWLGVPVSIVDGQFALTMEWGLRVRGTYDLVVAPQLIVMRWDFASGTVPLPGQAQRGYLEISPRADGCHVAVAQLAASDEVGERMARAWGLVLERFREYVVDALDPTQDMPLRPATTTG